MKGVSIFFFFQTEYIYLPKEILPYFKIQNYFFF